MDADPPELTPRQVTVRVLTLLVFALVSTAVAAIAGFAVNAEECGLFGPPPASYSPQGGTCGRSPGIWNIYPALVWVVASGLPVVLTWWAWQRYGGGAAASTMLLSLVAAVCFTQVASSAPSDECSAEQRAAHPRNGCHNYDDGSYDGRP